MSPGARARKLWPRSPVFAALPLTVYSATMFAVGTLRWEHLAAWVLVAALAFWSERSRRFLAAFFGFLAVAILYDAGRFIRNLGITPERIINCGMYELERRWFGVVDGGARVTLQDYFLAHHALAADLFFAVPYATFIAVCVAWSVYLFFVDEGACRRFGWGFFALNVMGMVTYHLLPCAPPWYFHQYGCAIHLDVFEFEGHALARVDLFTGLGYFKGFYGRASEVFGALPSLHVAYPLLIVLEGWRRHRWAVRAATLFYFVWMCAAAIYLDHHWTLDLVMGWSYSVAVFVAMRLFASSPVPSNAAGGVPVPARVMQSSAERPPGG